MIDGRGEPSLVDEHGKKGLVAGQMTVRPFDGDEGRPLALVGGACEVHRRHSSQRQLDEQLVRPESLRSVRRSYRLDGGHG